MSEHEPSRDVLTELPPDLEQRLRSASVAVRDRGSRSVPVTVAAARSRSRRRHAILGVAMTMAIVAVGLAAVSLAGRDASPTLQTGSSGSTNPASGPSAITWETPTVSLHADQVRILAAGQEFAPPTEADQMDVHSDPGNLRPNGYTTLELAWEQHGVEMRINLYLMSDADRWWANEIRIYDGQARGDWITFEGRWFDAPLGQSYIGDLHLTNAEGSLDIDGLQLQAFLPSTACQNATTPDVLESLYPTIEMGLPPSGFGAAVRLYDGTCTPISDLSGVAITWTADDPTVVAVVGDSERPTRADLEAVRSGSTVLHVVATDRITGAVLATTSMQVEVTAT